jgi:hypothetical protein
MSHHFTVQLSDIQAASHFTSSWDFCPVTLTDLLIYISRNTMQNNNL